jgi:hypothetical protein
MNFRAVTGGSLPADQREKEGQKSLMRSHFGKNRASRRLCGECRLFPGGVDVELLCAPLQWRELRAGVRRTEKGIRVAVYDPSKLEFRHE